MQCPYKGTFGDVWWYLKTSSPYFYARVKVGYVSAYDASFFRFESGDYRLNVFGGRCVEKLEDVPFDDMMKLEKIILPKLKKGEIVKESDVSSIINDIQAAQNASPAKPK